MRSLVLAFLIAASGSEAAAAGKAAEVLVLHSTRRDGILAATADREIPRVLAAGLDQPLDYYAEYIDSARFPDASYRSSFRQFLRLKYRQHRFDLVITVGSTPMDFADRVRQDLSPRAPLVFYSFNQPSARPPNSTGVYSFIDLARTLRLATALQPDVSRVFVVTGSSDQDKYYENLAREQFQTFAKLSFTYLSGLTMAELEHRLATLPAHSLVYYVALFRDRAGVNFPSIPVVGRVTAASTAPVYAWQSSTLDYGVVGGALVHSEIWVAALADQALRVLRGERADDIPTATPDPYVNEVDWRALRRWNISEASVPAGTRIDFREPDLWDRYRAAILSAVALVLTQTSIIAGLFVQSRRRRRAEARVVQSEGQLRATCERLRDIGNRLITAQEIERSRIARELHDDLSQQAALLVVHLDLLRSGEPLPEESGSLADVAFRDATEIARSLRDLSHRLHPAKLRLLGLVPSLEGLEREFRGSETLVSFSHDDVPPALPFDLTLCFFRIVQEAVQNAVRHGGARHVSIHLSGGGSRLALTIMDDGTGFDVKSAWGKGLGLISIAERLESLGGMLTIRSGPDIGTCLEITAPIGTSAMQAVVA